MLIRNKFFLFLSISIFLVILALAVIQVFHLDESEYDAYRNGVNISVTNLYKSETPELELYLEGEYNIPLIKFPKLRNGETLSYNIKYVPPNSDYNVRASYNKNGKKYTAFLAYIDGGIKKTVVEIDINSLNGEKIVYSVKNSYSLADPGGENREFEEFKE
ncbi:hypothetical protein [Niallia sp. 01092]|uniref:hypothetical protein n=1 Tax=unclassified Niallia TaxID=2837522 RepID=UPI003FD67920